MLGFRRKIALNFEKDEKELTEFYIMRVPKGLCTLIPDWD